MHLQLEGKTALVSRSSQGIGFAIAEALAREGATVVINSYKQELVDQAIDRLTKMVLGVQLIGAVADLATAEGVQGKNPREDLEASKRGPIGWSKETHFNSGASLAHGCCEN